MGYSVYERSDSPYYWIAVFCPRKLKRKAISSGFRRDDPLGYKHALDKARKLAENSRAETSELAAASWATWVDPYLRMKYAQPSQAGTLKIELHRWRWVEAFLAERKILTPSGVTYQVGLDFMEWRQRHKTRGGHGGWNNALGELRFLGRLMREAVRRGFVAASPLERMGLKRHKPEEKPEITNEEIAAIRAALAARESHLPIGKQWMTVCFEIAIHQGCRLTETQVPLADIDEAAGTIRFRQKGDRIFTTRLHDGLMPLIRRLRAAKLTHTCELPRMAAKEWHWFFKGRPERNWPAVAPRLCFHCTRVTVITRLARAGVPIAKAMAYVGHADATIHRIYQRLQAPDLEAATAAISF